jgi:carbamate kinase
MGTSYPKKTFGSDFLGKEIIVVALGGNALIKPGQRGTAAQQFRVVEDTCENIKKLVDAGYMVVMTHGNGPQVGSILLQQEYAQNVVPPMPLDVCGAQSQGQIGYMLQRALLNKGIPSSTIITQVVVDEKDPAFQNPTKPVGPFYPKDVATELKRKRKWEMVKKAKGWRRVVPSPEPTEIIEINEIKRMAGLGVVIACGGGGIPVVRKRGVVKGVEAVIDKDLVAEQLATALKTSTLLILTDVEKVALNYGKANQRNLSKMTLEEAKRYLADGQFPEGTMGPKITAAMRFLENGGKRIVISTPQHASRALTGDAGTTVAPR